MDEDVELGPARDTTRGARASRDRWICVGVVVLLLGQMAAAMLFSARDDSPTYDELAHTAAAIAYVRLHDLNVNPEHPPLAKLIAGIPFLFSAPRLPASVTVTPKKIYDDTGLGRHILYDVGNSANHIIWLARIPMIIMTLLFALAVFGFATDLFGWGGGLIALAAATLCPSLIAHGRLVHTDVAMAGFLLITAWMLWRSANRDRRWLAAAAVAFGLALGSKFTALLAVGPFAGLAFFGGFLFRRPDRRMRTRVLEGIARTALFVVVSWGVVWGVYAAVDTHLRYTRVEQQALHAHGVLATLADHLPLPAAYRDGLRYVVYYDETPGPAFLNGIRYVGGRIDFYPRVLVMKTPLGIITLWVAALAVIARSRRRWELAAYILLAPLSLLAVAMASGTNRGIRHVIYVPTLLAVAAGALSTIRGSRRLFVAGAVVVALAGSAVSVWHAFPSYLAYTNEAFGGLAAAPKRFADSNVDWGQDLRRLAAYVRAHDPHETVSLLYFGTAKPDPYGLNYVDASSLSRSRIKGLVALSVSRLNLYPQAYGWIPAQGRLLAVIGESILLYRI
jgi:hypothetical protein